jgi:RsiW-degrading membrane proteinase PrsW (M82 family)
VGLVLLILATFVFGGAAVLLLQRWNRSRLDPAGAVFLWAFPVVGALSVLPGFALYALADTFLPPAGTGRWAQILFVWTVNAPAEELAKYLCFALAARWLSSLREPQDGSLQGAATGLGFALVENALYGLSGGWELWGVRTVLSLPGHVIYGAVWGGYHGFEVYQGKGRVVRWWVPALALVPAAFSHAAYNTLSIAGAPLLFTLATDTLTLGFGLFLFLRLRALSPAQQRRPLRQWSLAIPELEHALALNPRSDTLRQRLAAYCLAAHRPQRALEVLEAAGEGPWTQFYRDAARLRLGLSEGSRAPESSRLNPALFRKLSGD